MQLRLHPSQTPKMAMPIFLNHNLNFQKIDKKSNLNSLMAFILSILIYVSVFYIFSLSPSSLVHTTTFWFILSNTLVLIIAADSRTFYPPPKELDAFGENNIRPEVTTLPYFQTKHITSKHHAQLTVDDQQPPEKIIGVVAAAADADPVEARKKRRRKNEAGVMDEKFDGKKMKEEIVTGEKEGLEEDDEFSRMSDEEVNRRVEEFIRRFNRQIRVQAAMNRRQFG